MAKLIICGLGVLYCLAKSFMVDLHAASAIHEIYGALYSLMAVIFLCTGFIIEKDIKSSKNDKEEK